MSEISNLEENIEQLENNLQSMKKLIEKLKVMDSDKCTYLCNYFDTISHGREIYCYKFRKIMSDNDKCINVKDRDLGQ